MIGLLRESMYESVLVVAQWIGSGKDGLIPLITALCNRVMYYILIFLATIIENSFF